MEEPRIGVYVCNCGTNIAGTVDVAEVSKYAGTLPNVTVARDYVYMCSAPGQDLIKNDIKEHGLNRIVVASCSPRMHEPTFRGVLEEGGLNPYLFEMANIREHCSWVHTHEPKRATEKAKDLVRIAVAKARLLEPLQKIRIDVTQRALIVGGGVSGLRACLDLAERGFEVHVVEKRPTVGGRAALINKLAHVEKKGSDIFKSIIDEAASNPKVNIHTNATLSTLDGYIGNYAVKINRKPRFVNESCNACGECATVCPIEVPNEYEYNLNKRKAIYIPFTHAYPSRYVIDADSCNRCGKCVEACKENAIDLDQEPKELELIFGTIILATGYDPYEPSKDEYSYGLYDNVITLLQLERLLDENGPTKGELTIKGSHPENIVFISCVGSMQEPKSEASADGGEPAEGLEKQAEAEQRVQTNCSRMCCAASIKNMMEIKERNPYSSIYFLYRDIRTYGRGDEQMYKAAGEEFLKFIRYEEPPKISTSSDNLKVEVYDTLVQSTLEIPTDLAVLAVGMTPPKDIEDLQDLVRVSRSADGFFQEAHAKLRPLETATDGIYLTGVAQGPKDIVESVASGSAAAAKASIPLAKGEMELEPTKSFVAFEACDGCAMCIDPCTQEAITLIEYMWKGDVKKTIELNEAKCVGCGVCQATCPKRGIFVRHFTLDQLSAMVETTLSG